MSHKEPKTLPGPPKVFPETGDFGNLTAEELRREIARFSRHLRKVYALQIADDPWKFKRGAVGLLRLGLPPFAGRPRDPAISHAIQLRMQGQEWKEIYPQVIPLHSELDPLRRQHAEFNLRSAVRSRRNTALR